MATTPSIINVVPAPDSLGIILKQQVSVTFNQEIDTTTVNDGTFVLIGPDKSTVFSPVDLAPFDSSGLEEEEVRSSPYVAGYVKGTFAFSRVDEFGEPVDESIKDTTGDGSLWFTVATFIPDAPLEPNKNYVVTIAGDESATDDFNSGIKTRTVFDTVKSAGSGTGVLSFQGGYTGLANTSYVVRFLTSGAVGVAEYEWWEVSNPLVAYQGISTTGERELEDGVIVTCEPDGNFLAGDTFTVVVRPFITMPNNYRWSFTTGNGSIEVPPSTSSASGIDSITNSSGVSSTSFNVVSIDPAERKYGVPIGVDPYVGETIAIVFSDDVDATSVSGNIVITSESANGDPKYGVLKELEWDADVSGNTIIIMLTPGQLEENNIVVIRLLKNISNLESATLGSDYISYFSTPYTPLYSSLRRIQLDLGSLIDGISEETIMFAIWTASLDADANSFIKTSTTIEYFQFARTQYTTCLAELILVRALLGTAAFSDRMSKELGDLKVSRGGLGLQDKLKGLENCVAQWKVPLTTGGLVTSGASLLPMVAVKGSMAEDAIAVHRQWEPTSGIGISAANNTVYASGRRRLTTFRNR